MLRRFVLVSLAMVMLLSMVSVTSAALNVGTTSKKGSLLVFPKIAVLDGVGTTGYGSVDTYIFIGNDAAEPFWVKCYWMDQNQSIEDFHFYITANQPVVFAASQGAVGIGPPFGANTVGSLVCWAQDAEDISPVKQNHLYGYAMIKEENSDSGVFYNATSFMMNGSPPSPNPSDTVTLPLDGSTYDMCPKYLTANFVTGYSSQKDPSPIPGVKADLTLWPCRQDLRQDRIPTCTKAKFDVWNGHEVKFTGAYACFKCFFEGYLDHIGLAGYAGYTNNGKTNTIYGKGPGFGYDKFGPLLKTAVARMRIQGIASSICDNGKTKGCVDSTGAVVRSVNSPLLGVLLYGNEAAREAANALGSQDKYILPVAGHNLHGAGGYTGSDAGFIKHNPSTTVVTGKKSK